MNRLIRLLFLIFMMPVLAPADVSAQIHLKADDYLPFIGHSDSLLIMDAEDRELVSIHADVPRTPASTLKLMTALMAIHYLGPDYRFVTEVDLDSGNNLRIKGYGDPMLTSEILMNLAHQIASRIRRFRDLVLETEYFDSSLAIPGVEKNLEPYNAVPGSLCANFNTVAFKTDRKGRYVSDEPQTPLLPVAIEKIKPTHLSSGRISFSHDPVENTRYAGHLIGYFLNQQGVVFTNRIRVVTEPSPSGKRVVRFESPLTLAEIVSGMLEFSSNFTANQIFLSCGARMYGPPATLEKAVSAARSFCQNIGLPEGIHMVEGSGISRDNHLSARHLSQILKRLEPHIHLLRHQDREWFKTGTLDGVRSRAGFVAGRDGRRYRFVVMMNTPGKTVDAVMKKILEDL